MNPAFPLLLLGSSTDLCTRVELNVAVQHDSRANFACREGHSLLEVPEGAALDLASEALGLHACDGVFRHNPLSTLRLRL